MRNIDIIKRLYNNYTKQFLPKILFLCYSITFLSLIYIGLLMNFNYIYFLFLIFPFVHLFFFQLIKLNAKNPNLCLKIFKSNNLLGLIIFLNLLVGKLTL